MADIEIGDLLRYKTKVELKNNSEKVLKTVWIRLLGDYDLQLCYKLSRLASAKKRATLRDHKSEDFQAEIESVSLTTSIEECINLIKNARSSTFVGEAYAVVDRGELPKMDEVTDEPDGPTLEDQEILDKKTAEVEQEYQGKIEAYLKDRLDALDSELRAKPESEVYELVEFELSNVLAMQEFQVELTAQKIFRATYRDEKCTVRAYKTIEEFKNGAAFIKSQLVEAYNDLDLSGDEIKN